MDPLTAKDVAVKGGRIVAYCSPACLANADVPRARAPTAPQVVTRPPRRLSRLVAITASFVLVGTAMLWWRYGGRTQGLVTVAPHDDARTPDASPPDASPPSTIEWRTRAALVLGAELASPHADQRLRAAMGLARIRDENALARLREIVETTQGDDAWNALYALARADNEQARATLLGATARGSARLTVLERRAWIGDATVQAELSRLLRDESVWWRAAQALAHIPPLVPRDARYLHDKSQEYRPELRQRATIALAAAGDATVMHEVEGLLLSEERFEAAVALAMQRRVEGESVLLAALGEPTTSVRAAWALRRSTFVAESPRNDAPWLPAAQRTLWRAMESDDLSRRLAAAEASLILLADDADRPVLP